MDEEPKLNDRGEIEKKQVFGPDNYSDPRDPKFLSPDSIKDKESSGSKRTDDSSEKNQLGLDDSVHAGWGYSPSDPKASGFRGRTKQIAVKFVKKRASIGIIISLLALIGIGGSTMIQSSKAVHLAQLLGLPERTQDNTNDLRIVALYRFMRSGEPGENRVGLGGSLLYHRTVANLQKQGITIGSEGTRQRLGDITLDINKVPGLEGLSYDQKLNKIANDFKIERQNLVVRGSGSITVPKEFLDINSKQILLKTLNLSNKGAVSRAMNSRNFAKWFGEFSWFHPMRKTQESLATKIDSSLAERKAKKQIENEAVTAPSAEDQSKINSFKEKLQGSSGFKVGVSSLAVADGVCMVKEVAEGVSYVQYASAVLPTQKASLKYKALGAQNQSGDDFRSSTLGDELSTLTDKDGRDVFSARSLNALAGSNKGVDMDEGLKSAFDDENKAASIVEAMNSIPGVSAACSPIGIGIQTVVGVALLATGGAGNFIVKGVTSTGSSLVIGRVISFAQNLFAKDLSKAVMSGGPLGGNLLAHGAMSFAGSSARSFGGVAFGAVASEEIRSQRIAEYKDEFNKSNFIDRAFNVYDQRSLASSVIDQTPSSSTQILGSLASSFKVSSLIGGLFNFDRKAYAEERPYNWSLKEYGFSAKILNDKKYEDPYQNAEKVVSFIEGSSYKERALACFGANIYKDQTGKWSVTTDQDTNPASAEYHQANCGDESEENWIRVRLFILDTKNMNAIFCFEAKENEEGAQEACADTGLGSGTETQTTQSGEVSADLSKTIEVKTPGEFITLPSEYSCPGRTTEIDSRIAPALAYILTTYNMCADDGLANGHKSHGAGFGVDIRPKDQSKQNSKDEWINTAEKFLLDINWWGASANQGNINGCATYSGYGNCIGGANGPTGTIPKWVRWIGYNGDVDHGDPWHVFGGRYAHIHLGWDNPAHDAVSPTKIRPPRSTAYTFPAPITEDIAPLLSEALKKELLSYSSTNVSSEKITGEVAQLAKDILATSNISYPLDATSPNGSTKAVLQTIADGKKAPVTCTGGSVSINPNVLKFVLELGRATKIGVNALTDKCHSDGSNHYSGMAVDFECQAVAFNITQADPIASKYSGRRNSETCTNNRHWHYDFTN